MTWSRRAELPPWKRIEPWAAALALAWCAVRLGRGLGPVPFYNSDCAVPILLMQGMGEGSFALYYPRQDRFGMWPFLLGRVLHLVSPEAFHVLSVIALCTAALPMSALLGSPALGVLTLIAPFVLRASVSEHFLQSGQPYLWQVVALVWAWWAMRAALEMRSLRARTAALAGLTVASALAVWMNGYSLVPLAVLLLVEAVRARVRVGRLLGPVAALGLAGLVEAGLRHRYNAYCQHTFGETFITPLRVDRGRVMDNVVLVVISLLKEGGLWPLLLGGTLAFVPGRSRAERMNLLGLLALAAAPLPAFALIRYFRESHFAGRYLAFSAYWALAAATCGTVLLLAQLAARREGLVKAVALAGLVLVVPAGPGDFLAPQRAEAAALAARGPRLLLADYWDVYVPASLAPPGLLLPIGANTNLNRYPATQAELLPGRRVLAPCALDRPDGTLEQYGALLRRTDDPPVPGLRGPWCGYVVERPARPVRPDR